MPNDPTPLLHQALALVLLIIVSLPAVSRCIREVPPMPDQPTVEVRNVSQLERAMKAANRTGSHTVLLHDGLYQLRNTIVVKGKQISIRSLSGNRDQVVLRGDGMDGGIPHVLLVQAPSFQVVDVTVGWVRHHGIQVQGERGG